MHPWLKKSLFRQRLNSLRPYARDILLQFYSATYLFAFLVVMVYIAYMPILKLTKDNEAKELEFELAYMAKLTTQERFQMMLAKSREMAKLLRRNGRRRITQITKRT
jgi:hypothetical protein